MICSILKTLRYNNIIYVISNTAKLYVDLSVTYIDDYNIEETNMPEELMKNLRVMSVFEQNLPRVCIDGLYNGSN